ncbi:MAG: MMPL family transporter [Solirubrobacterales bacterium]|nr:MMPL family transporter [Solirubrobacterales bacterium]
MMHSWQSTQEPYLTIFQRGWGHELLGFTPNGAIIPFLPLFRFVVLFGLSMDYHVFILSRIREARESGFSNDDAVRRRPRTPRWLEWVPRVRREASVRIDRTTPPAAANIGRQTVYLSGMVAT